jgi:CO/xanthine dehydrogenase Mo-binding subunit
VSDAAAPHGLTRRELLVRSGWLSAGLTVLVSCSRLPALPTRDLPDADDADGWLQLLPDGRVRLYCPRSEMGQGIATGLAQVVAEELDLERERIECVQPATDGIAPTIMTVGSWSMLEFYEPTARAAARLRDALRARAAERAGVEPGGLEHRGDGFDLPGGSRLRFAELVGDGPEFVAPTGEPERPYLLEPGRPLHRAGRDWSPLGAEQIATGREVYSRDFVLPDMRYGAVAKPPRAGARLVAWREEVARALPDVLDVVVDHERALVGIVARTPFALSRAEAALAAEWEGGDALDQAELDARLDVDAALERGDLEHEPMSDGDLEAGRRAAARTLDARYDSPMTAHGAMEPRAAVAQVRDDGVEVWTASQDPWLIQKLVAKELGRSNSDVVVHNHRLGGAFGGRTLCQAALEAAWLSGHVREAVSVRWTREEEFAHNNVGPQFSHRIRAGVDADGRVTHWDHAMVSCPIIFTSALIPESLHWLLDFPSDPGTMRNARPPYAFANRRLRFSDVRIPIVTGAWRGLGAAPNAFAVESAMDELAALAGADPLAFRLEHVPAEQPRLRRVLERVGALSGWGEPSPPGLGRGVACAIYKDATYVAVVAEVEASRPEGPFRIRRVFCAHDCGRVVSPGQVRAQIEGNVAWGCSMALHERVVAHAGAPAAQNFDSYPVLRMSEMPEIEIDLVESAGTRPSGAGESALVPTPAAIANALYAATGSRSRRLPLLASPADA